MTAMSIRSIIMGFGMLVLLCGAGVYGVYSYFGRDAQMRASELRYNTAHADRIAKTQAAAAARLQAEGDETTWAMHGGDTGNSEDDDMSMSDWYANAGSDDTASQ